MTPEQRLELLEDLKGRERQTLRRARIGAWGSVLLAACVTAVLLYVAYGELGRVEADIKARSAELGKVNERLKTAQEQLEATNKKLRAWQTVVSEMPKPQIEASFTRAAQSDPSIEKILPRVYIQRPAGDEALKRAEAARRSLRQAGFVVLGIEVRPEAVGQTHVRYYKSTDAAQAEKATEALRGMGEPVGPAQHLKRFETSPSVQPNHYEVWLSGAPRPPV